MYIKHMVRTFCCSIQPQYIYILNILHYIEWHSLQGNVNYYIRLYDISK